MWWSSSETKSTSANSSSFGEEVDEGLYYRYLSPFVVEVLCTPTWFAYRGEEEVAQPPQARTMKELAEINAKASCNSEAEAIGVTTVASNMDLFCEHCREQVMVEDRRCPECRKKLWVTPIVFRITHSWPTGSAVQSWVALSSVAGCLTALARLVVSVAAIGLVVSAVRGCVGDPRPARPLVVGQGGAPERLPGLPAKADIDAPVPTPNANNAAVEADADLFGPADRPAGDEVAIEETPQETAADRIDKAKWRTWKSENGKFTLYAKFVTVINGRMTLEKEDGSRTNVELERLCEDDIKFVRRQEWKKAGKPGIQ